MIVAGIQMSVSDGETSTNIAKAYSMVRRLSSANPDIVVLPELWCCGYKGEYGSDDSRLALNAMYRFSGITGGLVVGSIPWVENGEAYNKAVAVYKGRMVGEYSKIHLFEPFKEHEIFKPGENPSIIKYKGFKIGLAVCYDLRFPELIREYSLHGADIVIAPSAWGKPRLNQWRNITTAQAAVNQVYLLAVNRVGEGSLGEEFAGHSVFVDPWGDRIVEAGVGEAIIIGWVEKERVAEARGRIPILDDYMKSRKKYRKIKFYEAG
ncbi:MAG: hypothetical protein GSR82_01375 [Desulfurococcales archaeon]|nr:hypothetical protein [Desulfurococcales archaeon]